MTDQVNSTSKLVAEISGLLNGDHHDQQTRDIRRLVEVLNPLLVNFDSVKEAVVSYLIGGNNVEYDIPISISGKLLVPNSPVAIVVIPRNVTLYSGLVKSYAKCIAPPSSDTLLIIRINNIYVGQILFPASSNIGTFDFDLTLNLIPGDILEIRTHSIVNSELKDIAITIVGCAELTRCSLPTSEE